MSSRFSFRLIFILSALVLSSACRKDIKTPGDQSVNVFGSWLWVSSFSGAGGVSQTPTSTGESVELEYESNGVFKEFRDGKKTEKLIFEFIEGTSINFQLSGYVIKYRNSGLNRKEKFREEFGMIGADTLLLKRDCSGCFTRMFVRQ